MRSSYKRIGSCIRLVDERNTGLNVNTLLGVSISKELMPSVANIVGADMENYKILRKNQFTCSLMQVRRDGRIPIAILKDFDEAIVSQAYPVFEVINTGEVLPDYLMMWFSRSEFDRESCFYAIGGVRGSLEWDDFCNMQLPVPHPDKQKEIVREYNVLKDRIALNNKLIQRLEETAQAIYKQWFVDFEFPDENGKPYKSSGGEMEYSEELGKEIPKGWESGRLSGIAKYRNGLAMQNFRPQSSSFIPVIKIRELSLGISDEASDKATIDLPPEYIINNGDIIFSWSGTLKVVIWAGGKGGLNQHLFKVTSNKFEKWFYYLWTKFHLEEFIRVAAGKAVSMGHIKRENLDEAIVLIPLRFQLQKMDEILTPLLNSIITLKIEQNTILRLVDLLLSNLTTSDSKK